MVEFNFSIKRGACAGHALMIVELLFLIFGAFIYSMLLNFRNEGKDKPHTVADNRGNSMPYAGPVVRAKSSNNRHMRAVTTQAPIVAPTFCSAHWDGEVTELLEQITPTVEKEEIVNQLARIVKRHLRSVLPDVEVEGYVSGNFTSGKAFGVAVPEVDIVASMHPAAMVARMQGRMGGECSAVQSLDANKLQNGQFALVQTDWWQLSSSFDGLHSSKKNQRSPSWHLLRSGFSQNPFLGFLSECSDPIVQCSSSYRVWADGISCQRVDLACETLGQRPWHLPCLKGPFLAIHMGHSCHLLSASGRAFASPLAALRAFFQTYEGMPECRAQATFKVGVTNKRQSQSIHRGSFQGFHQVLYM